MQKKLTRRDFLAQSGKAAAGMAAIGALGSFSKTVTNYDIKPGLVTYLWGKDWDIPTLIRNCSNTGFYGVELRVDHAHGVAPSLNKAERKNVNLRFSNSPVEIVGMGTNFDFHHVDQSILKKNIEGAKEYIILSHEIGGSGVKVKPNALPPEVPAEKTFEQIGKSFNEIGRFAQDYNQKIRVEVHGKDTQKLPNMKKIFDHVTEPNVVICWNCNDQDLEGKGLGYNFGLVEKWLGDTIHHRELNIGDYPYDKLFKLFTGINYKGWFLLEARTSPADRILALNEQKEIFDKMLTNTK